MSRPTNQNRFKPSEYETEFKRLRKNAKLSQQELSVKMNVAVSTIARWEKGQCEPTMTLEQVRFFCLAVNKTIAKLPKKLSQRYKTNHATNY